MADAYKLKFENFHSIKIIPCRRTDSNNDVINRRYAFHYKKGHFFYLRNFSE